MLKRINGLKGNNGGFQLVELLIVIALISTLLAIGVPALVGQIGHIRLRSSTRDMATELGAARLKAIAQNTKYRISFSVPDSYVLTKWDKTISSWVSEPNHSTLTTSAGIVILTPAANFITEFYPNGTAKDGGGGLPNTICINNSGAVNDRMNITVAGSTGMIKVQTGC